MARTSGLEANRQRGWESVNLRGTSKGINGATARDARFAVRHSPAEGKRPARPRLHAVGCRAPETGRSGPVFLILQRNCDRSILTYQRGSFAALVRERVRSGRPAAVSSSMESRMQAIPGRHCSGKLLPGRIRRRVGLRRPRIGSTPSAGSLSGRPMAPQSTTNATDPIRPHSVPAGAAARGQLHRPHRGQHRR